MEESVRVVALHVSPVPRPPRRLEDVELYATPQHREPPLKDYALLTASQSFSALARSDIGFELAALRRRAAELGCDGLMVWPSHNWHRREWTAVCQVTP